MCMHIYIYICIRANSHAAIPLYTLLADLLGCRSCRTDRTGRVLDRVMLFIQNCYLGDPKSVFWLPGPKQHVFCNRGSCT